MATLLKDLIDIPERIYEGDFVLKLTEGIRRPEDTLRDYVVTPQLKDQFDNALSFVASALSAQQSKAAFLHGSFGSGKSHFMAVLNLILEGHAQAWSHADLGPIAARHPGLREKKFLSLAFHMINATSMEAKVLGGYVEAIRQRHPNCTIPPVYQGEQLFDNARHLRQTMGEEAFLQALGSSGAKSGGLNWGKAAAVGWTSASVEEAMQAPPGDSRRSALISALLDKLFPSYSQVQREGQESYVNFDLGLQIISQHARSLGYDAILLFLDELVLWLATMASNLQFVNQEVQKLVKLVEAERSDRALPILSLIARQRDLKELIGESVSGFEQFNFHDQIRHFEKRFHVIPLEDTNLPEIVSRRILRPKNEAARAQIEEAFSRLNLKAEVRDILQDQYDLDSFRKVYPFSPALIDTLVAVSSMLQRNRTAILILMELLISQRDHLSLGTLIPVGDLFDLVANDFQPYSPEVKRSFETARRLLHERFQPLLEEGGVSTTPQTDLRLFKTVLLASLVPQVRALRQLTPRKLAALNHGTLKAPIPGQDAAMVLKRLQNWQTNINELRVNEETQEISLNLTTVDLERILEPVRSQDSPGNRKRYLREILFQMMNIPYSDQGTLSQTYTLTWRGTRRSFEVLYLNVREQADLRGFQAGDVPRVILDYPFDEESCSPKNDLDRLQSYRDTYGEDTRTLVWVPRFLSRKTMNDLGRLLLVEHLLAGERFQQYTQNLSLQDRPQARMLLENQRSGLKAALRKALEMAYGILQAEPGYLDESDANQLSQDQILQSLHSAFQPRMPAAISLQAALEELLCQELQAHYPAHPEFPTKEVLSPALIKTVWKEIQSAASLEQPRLFVPDKGLREKLKLLAEPLRLGSMGDDHFVLKDHWKQHLEQEMSKRGLVGSVRVADLNQWLDVPRPMGLTPPLRSLILHTFALQTHRQVVRHGLALRDFELELPPDTELRPQELPPEELWQVAWQRTRLVSPELYAMQLSGANVGRLWDHFRAALSPHEASGRQLAQRLRSLCECVQVDPAQCPSLDRAYQAVGLLDCLKHSDPRQGLEALVSCSWSEPQGELWPLLSNAGTLVGALSDPLLNIVQSLPALAETTAEAGEMLAEARQLLSTRCDVVGLTRLLRHLETHVPQLWTRQVVVATPAPATANPVAPPPLKPAAPGLKLRRQGQLQQADAAQLQDQLQSLLAELQQPGRRVSLHWELWEES